MLIAWKQGFAQWSLLLEKWLSLYVGFTALWENLENQGKIWKIGENLENSGKFIGKSLHSGKTLRLLFNTMTSVEILFLKVDRNC